jgi:hypothetical protein
VGVGAARPRRPTGVEIQEARIKRQDEEAASSFKIQNSKFKIQNSTSPSLSPSRSFAFIRGSTIFLLPNNQSQISNLTSFFRG